MPTWLTTAALKAFFSALFGFVTDWMSRYERDQITEEKAKAEAERDQAREGERVANELAEEAGKRIDPEDAIKKLEDGSA